MSIYPLQKSTPSASTDLNKFALNFAAFETQYAYMVNDLVFSSHVLNSMYLFSNFNIFFLNSAKKIKSKTTPSSSALLKQSSSDLAASTCFES